MRKWIAALVGLALAGVALFLVLRKPYPSDTTPEGAYARIAESIARENDIGVFPYLEDDAQWAAHSIRDARKKALERIEQDYPADQRDVLRSAYAPVANAKDGAEVFVLYARAKGWLVRLRKDLSGVASVDVDGDRATLVTARQSRYTFRKRKNGIWGLVLFTSELVAEKERTARDLEVVSHAADDYRANRK